MAFDAELLYEIEAEYEDLRQKNAMDLENRKRAVFIKVPRLEEVDSEIKALGLKLYKIAISGGDVKPQIDELRASQKKLLTVKKALLLENGYSEDELSLRYSCDAAIILFLLTPKNFLKQSLILITKKLCLKCILRTINCC